MKKSTLIQCILIFVLFSLLFYKQQSKNIHPNFQIATRTLTPVDDETPFYEEQFITGGEVTKVHSAAVIELSNNVLRSFWYGGTREGARDVAIFSSVYDPHQYAWTPPERILTREAVRNDLHRHIRKLGNVVVAEDTADTLYLFFVTTSVGGWSTAAVNLTMSSDGGMQWSRPKRLVTSPFFNVSTLVKGPPIFFEDHTIWLPVYHECFGKFGEFLHLDRDGTVLAKQRIGYGITGIQPVVVPYTPQKAVGFLRNRGTLLTTHSADAGKTWDLPSDTALPNPHAGVATIRLQSGAMMKAFNNSADERHNLALGYSDDNGVSWRLVHYFENQTTVPDGIKHEFSYPCLLQTHNGDLHLLYTWYKKQIKHIHFNRAWLEEKL